MDDLAKTLRDFAKERDWQKFHTPKNLAMALSVEVAELVENFQWLTADESAKPDKKKLDDIADEIGDTLIYLVMLADKLGIDPVEAARVKVEKNRAKYPAGKVRGKSDKYTEY